MAVIEYADRGSGGEPLFVPRSQDPHACAGVGATQRCTDVTAPPGLVIPLVCADFCWADTELVCRFRRKCTFSSHLCGLGAVHASKSLLSPLRPCYPLCCVLSQVKMTATSWCM